MNDIYIKRTVFNFAYYSKCFYCFYIKNVMQSLIICVNNMFNKSLMQMMDDD